MNLSDALLSPWWIWTFSPFDSGFESDNLCESDSDIEGRTPQTEASTPVHQKFVLLSKSLKCPTPFLSVKSSILWKFLVHTIPLRDRVELGDSECHPPRLGWERGSTTRQKNKMKRTYLASYIVKRRHHPWPNISGLMYRYAGKYVG